MKSQLLDHIRTELRTRLERLSKAAFEAHAAATDPGSKAEGKYDTRSLEASYLAAGQARQVDELAESLRIFESLSLPDFQPDAEIDAGALVEADLNRESACFLLVPTCGGMVVEHLGMEITLLGPDSALYGKLVGMRAGESLETPSLSVSGVS
ncbi:MAG: transcription elongation factor GreAB [Luteolibacter sp.]